MFQYIKALLTATYLSHSNRKDDRQTVGLYSDFWMSRWFLLKNNKYRYQDGIAQSNRNSGGKLEIDIKKQS